MGAPAIIPEQKPDPSLGEVGKAYPKLVQYLPQVTVQRGKPEPNDNRQLEFYPPWESRNPNPGKITIEMYRDFHGPERTNAIAGDLLHYIGARNPSTKQPIDPKYWAMKQQVVKSRTPEQKYLDDRLYEEAKRRGESRSFEDWMQESRADAYIRGWITPDQADE